MTAIVRICAMMPMLTSGMSVERIAQLTGLFNTLAIVAFCIAGIAVAASVFIWIKLDIKNVIGFLSGKNAAKAIEALLSGKQAYRSKGQGVRPADMPRKGSGYSGSEEATTPLSDTDRTVLLNKNYGDETVPLDSGRSEETVLLDQRRSEETVLLDRDAPPMRDKAPKRRDDDHYGAPDIPDIAPIAPEPTPAAPDEPIRERARSRMEGFRCEETQIITDVWDEEIHIEL